MRHLEDAFVFVFRFVDEKRVEERGVEDMNSGCTCAYMQSRCATGECLCV